MMQRAKEHAVFHYTALESGARMRADIVDRVECPIQGQD